MARDSVDQLMDFLSNGLAAQNAVDEVIEDHDPSTTIERAAIEALDRARATRDASKKSSADGFIRSADLPCILERETEALIAVVKFVVWQLRQGDGETLRTGIHELERAAIRVVCMKDRIEREKVRGVDEPG